MRGSKTCVAIAVWTATSLGSGLGLSPGRAEAQATPGDQARSAEASADGPNEEAGADRRLLDRARDLFVAATGHYEAGRLRRATRVFQASLALVDRPSTRFNLARTWQRLGQPGLAIVEYQAYLAGSRDAQDAAEVRALIDVLNSRVADAGNSRPEQPPTSTAGPQAGSPLPLPVLGATERRSTEGREPIDRGAGIPRGGAGRQPSAQTPAVSAAADATDVALASPLGGKDGSTMSPRVPAYAAFAVGGATALASAWFGLSAIQQRDELASGSIADRSEDSRLGFRRRADGIRSDALAADLLGAAALTATLTGVWLYLSPPSWGPSSSGATGSAGDADPTATTPLGGWPGTADRHGVR